MAIIRTCCLLLFLAFPWLFSSAQVSDSLPPPPDSSAAFYFYKKNFIYDPSVLYPKDSALLNLQKYNPARYPEHDYATLGNIGLAVNNLVFTPPSPTGFDLGIHTFDIYLLRDQTVQFFTTLRPFTQLFYVMGKYREQVFQGIHNQPIGKNFNVGARFSIINSFGGYLRQKADDNSVDLNASYFTKNKRYGIIADYSFNHLTDQENGGIANDSIFENKIETDTRLIPVNLQDAENRWKESGYHLTQYYSLSKKDTPAEDTTHRKAISRIFSPGSFIHSFSYSKYQLQFNDNQPDTLFFSDIYYDTALTYDETKMKTFENTVMWMNSRSPLCPFMVYLGATYQHTRLQEYTNYSLSRDDQFDHLIFQGGVRITPLKHTVLKADAQWTKGDYIKDDQKLIASIQQTFGRKNPSNTLTANAGYYNLTPSWFFHHYNSNHFRWDNDFKKEDIFLAGISLKTKLIETGVHLYHLINYIYIGTDTVPHQYNGDLSTVEAYAFGQWEFSHISLAARVVWQTVSNPDLIRVPAIISDASLYFNHYLFKHALFIQTGVDAYYNTSYYADAYMPELRSFFIQDEKKLSQLFILDVALKFRIKTVRLFLVYQHLNSLFGKKDYYMVPHYPVANERLKFGVNWRFHD
jgi:hypothetical protein